MKFLYEIVKSVVIYLILISFLLNLVGNSSFKKYIEIFSGMLLILILLFPLADLLKKGVIFDYHYDSNQFLVESTQFQKDLTEMEQGKEADIILNYKEQIRVGIRSVLEEHHLYPEKIDIELEENHEKEDYGEIQKLTLTASYTKGNGETDGRKILIEPVPKITMEEAAPVPEISSPLELKVKQELFDIYKIPTDRMLVSIREG